MLSGWLRPALLLAGVMLSSAAAAQGPATQMPGQRISVTVESLPPPGTEDSVTNPPREVPRPDGAGLNLPPGFTATLFAEGLNHARWLLAAENGDVFLAESRSGRITLLRDETGDGRADLIQPFAEGFARPHGMAIRDGFFWVADTARVWRAPYEPGQIKADAFEPVTAPGALGDAGGHWTRSLVFHPTAPRFFVGIGARGNIGIEPEPRATIQEFSVDGAWQRTYASGLRNPTGLAFHPQTGELWTVVNERDGMGERLVPDYLTQVQEGGFYGWPYAYLGPNPQPDFAALAPSDLIDRTILPDVLFEAHSAPMGFVFYDHDHFPEDYRGDAFVALRGSWNADEPVAYTVVRVNFRDGRPEENAYEIFASGFWVEGTHRASVWGRPVGLAVMPDGALLVADDTGQTVWRITYDGER
ncbi:sorbosone dehydrogenase family protein [Telmatospirillum sp. J64-1]|uniref:PQQ-dependent sugar dehydrogenase n=1 Tax=Telmatospirillum sp. J64-1 TaxID=2502183 RepID=UPI00115EC8AF|nr:PQQ-dependent sugar dehydrogenase [Telmatospirillum sp. J64-1]